MFADLATRVMTEVHHIAPMVASAGTSTPPVMSADDITTATGNIFVIVGQVLNEIVSQPVFRMFFVAGLLYTGIRIVKAIKHV